MKTEAPLAAPGDKPTQVRGMFARIASHYDRLNDLMTLGRHRAWKRTAIRRLSVRPGGRYLDLCTGTGDLALLLARVKKTEIQALDFSAEMLEVARQRTAPSSPIAWIQGDAMDLPFPAAHFDGVIVGFGLRNVGDLEIALREVARVLKPGGRFVSLDLGKPRNWLVRQSADRIQNALLPLLGRLLAQDAEAYRYLPRSNRNFVDQRQLAEQLKELGFQGLRVENRFLGSIAIVSAGR